MAIKEIMNGNATKLWRKSVLVIISIILTIGGYAYGKLDKLESLVPEKYVSKEDLNKALADLKISIHDLGVKVDDINCYLRDKGQ